MAKEETRILDKSVIPLREITLTLLQDRIWSHLDALSLRQTKTKWNNLTSSGLKETWTKKMILRSWTQEDRVSLETKQSTARTKILIG